MSFWVDISLNKHLIMSHWQKGLNLNDMYYKGYGFKFQNFKGKIEITQNFRVVNYNLILI